MSEDKSPAKPVHTERIFVSAEMARQWMRRNIPNNRAIAEGRVKQYARDMKNGQWKENGDTIKFSDQGALIDGQHRLSACISAGIGFWCLVAYGVKEEAFITIDRNQARSCGQVLRLSTGIDNANHVASALRWVAGFRDGIIINVRPTSGELAELLLEHPGISESCQMAGKVHRRFRAGPIPIIAVCHYLFTRQDATLAELFFDSLATGANLRENDPVFRLREKIIATSASASKRIPPTDLFALFFKVWLAEREQRTINTALRWIAGESFPNIGPIADTKVRPEKIAPVIKKKRVPTPAIPAPPARKSASRLDDLLSRAMSLDKR